MRQHGDYKFVNGSINPILFKSFYKLVLQTAILSIFCFCFWLLWNGMPWYAVLLYFFTSGVILIILYRTDFSLRMDEVSVFIEFVNPLRKNYAIEIKSIAEIYMEEIRSTSYGYDRLHIHYNIKGKERVATIFLGKRERFEKMLTTIKYHTVITIKNK